MKLFGSDFIVLVDVKFIEDVDKRLFVVVVDVCRRLDGLVFVYWDVYYVIKENFGEGVIFFSLVSCKIFEYMGR